RDADGQILGVLAISIDVTPQVLARQKIEEIVVQRTRELAHSNEALHKSNEELIRTNNNLEEFAYAASHDMKEPIRKIHFFSDLLKGELEAQLNDRQKQLFNRMEQASKRMGTLVDDLLAYSHASKGMLQEEPIDLNQKIKVVLEDLELEIQQKNAVVTAGPLPTIKGNRRQIQQLFQNLISNALKYSKPDVPPEVHIRAQKVLGADMQPSLTQAEAGREYHFIEVRDNGIGFPQADAERIFHVFTRLHGNAEYRGTGVGLSIVRKVVNNHGGIIWAESEPGQGSAFKILLPVV
ncbi:MAG TPA: ATP-binding protein, partial [Chitinophagaceae bacterium]|nr:ATP-binding protein [Chitinophagaceae bacterium]